MGPLNLGGSISKLNTVSNPRGLYQQAITSLPLWLYAKVMLECLYNIAYIAISNITATLHLRRFWCKRCLLMAKYA